MRSDRGAREEEDDGSRRARRAMVETQLEGRGIRDVRVLEAMANVPRERFVPSDLAAMAYRDAPLPLGEGQTISQPYVVALMLQALVLEPQDRVLEVGTGSGYAAAVLSRVAAEVYSIERFPSLARRAESVLRELGYDNVRVRCGDGSMGWAEYAPFDAILVSAGAPTVPQSLSEQLADGGRLVIPVGADPELQVLMRRRRRGECFEEERLGGVRFVPLIGEEGW